MRFRLRRIGLGYVPAGGRRFHVDRFIGLRHGFPGLYCKPRSGERLLIKLRSDFVAFLSSIFIALIGSEREPFVRLSEVLRHADTARIQDAEIVLAVGDAAISGFAEPMGGVAVIRRA